VSQPHKTGTVLTILVAAMFSGCSTTRTKAAGFAVASTSPDTAGDAEKPSPFLDLEIARDLDAAFLGNRLHVTYQVNRHVVTLTGVVGSPSKRARAEEVAAAVVNVQQVVNELRVRPRQFESGKQ